MTDKRLQAVHIIGGGLAGSEAAWQIAARGVPVVLHEMRPRRATAAHKTADLAELACSNSFRSDDKEHNAVGLLHEEMRRLASLIMRTADANQVPAGGALAVDREGFAAAVTAALEAHPLIEISREEVAALPPADWDNVIIATGPLTSPALAEAVAQRTGENALAFFDAIAPIVSADSLDYTRLFKASRYGKGGGDDYWNAPFTREEYEAFVATLLAGEQYVPGHEFDNVTYFEGCLPVEEMGMGRRTKMWTKIR